MREHRRVLSAREQQHRISGLGDAVAQDVYRFRFESSQMVGQIAHASAAFDAGSLVLASGVDCQPSLPA